MNTDVIQTCSMNDTHNVELHLQCRMKNKSLYSMNHGPADYTMPPRG